MGETLRHVLNTLAIGAPKWLRGGGPSAWFDRYGRRFEEYRLPPGKAERYALAEQIGAAGAALLAALHASDAPDWLWRVPAVETLRRAWLQQFVVRGDRLRWRTAEELPSSTLLLRSPYDVEARYGQKRQTDGTDGTDGSGYKVHLTATCDDDRPSLITNVAPAAGPPRRPRTMR